MLICFDVRMNKDARERCEFCAIAVCCVNLSRLMVMRTYHYHYAVCMIVIIITRMGGARMRMTVPMRMCVRVYVVRTACVNAQ